MMRTTTQNELIRFIYNETGKNEEKHILDSYSKEKWVESELNKFLDIKNLLDNLFEDPSDGCTERIMDSLNGEKEGI